MGRIIYMMFLAICYGFSFGFFAVHAFHYLDIEIPSVLYETVKAMDEPSPDKIIPSDWVLVPYSDR